MAANLKPRGIPAGIAISRSFQISELDFIRRMTVMYFERKRRLKQLVLLRPLNFGVKVDPGKRAVKIYRLDDCRGLIVPRNPQSGPVPVINRRKLRFFLPLQRLFLIVSRDVPGVIILRKILKQQKLVAYLSLLEHLTLKPFINQRGNPTVRIYLYAVPFIFNGVSRDFYAVLCFF